MGSDRCGRPALRARRPFPILSRLKSPLPSSPAVRKIMQGNKGSDTRPEIAIRSILHRRGVRYRKDIAPIPGLRRRADIVFTRQRLAVFIDGCFWHGCPEHYHAPRTNSGYWKAKVEKNRARDIDTNRRLLAEGWAVLRLWEHELPIHGVAVIQAALEQRRADEPSGT